jgi:3',5'-cyclic AMP phosphodiesterase CpdA
MKTIAHISDLHFGAEDPPVVAGLLKDLLDLQPCLVIVSGDLTQRARRSQFAAAREYLQRIPYPLVVVPGNHDVPLYDFIRRFASPLERYKHYISDDLNPVWQDDGLVVLGLNTARSFTWKSGRISHDQIAFMREQLCPIPESTFKILVTHHPFIPPPGESGIGIDLVGRAALALETVEACRIKLMLSGHLHHGYTGDVRTFYPLSKASTVAVQAGTACSHRIRNEPNAYNRIRISSDHITITIRVWDQGAFRSSTEVSYRLRDGEWLPEYKKDRGPEAEKARTDAGDDLLR